MRKKHMWICSYCKKEKSETGTSFQGDPCCLHCYHVESGKLTAVDQHTIEVMDRTIKSYEALSLRLYMALITLQNDYDEPVESLSEWAQSHADTRFLNTTRLDILVNNAIHKETEDANNKEKS